MLKMVKHRRWTQEEVDFLEVFYREPDENYDSISDFLGRTKKEIESKRYRMNQEKGFDWYIVRTWTEKETQFLKDNYFLMESAIIAKVLKRTKTSIDKKAFKLGLRKNSYPSEKRREIERLVSDGYNSKEIAERTGFTPESIRKFCYRNNLKITYVSKKERQHAFRQAEQMRIAEVKFKHDIYR